MAVAALLDPQLCHVERLPPKPLCPEQVAVALEHAHHVVITDLLHASSGHLSFAEPQPGEFRTTLQT